MKRDNGYFQMPKLNALIYRSLDRLGKNGQAHTLSYIDISVLLRDLGRIFNEVSYIIEKKHITDIQTKKKPIEKGRYMVYISLYDLKSKLKLKRTPAKSFNFSNYSALLNCLKDYTNAIFDELITDEEPKLFEEGYADAPTEENKKADFNNTLASMLIASKSKPNKRH